MLECFFSLLTSMLPTALGPYREQIEPLWIQASELFGSVAARRGLAVGEAVEEFQILREVLVRTIYEDPPVSDRAAIRLRDLLRLNRLVDRGVTFASVGHADALFFALFQGSGVPQRLDDEVVGEVDEQLSAIREQLSELMSLLRH